MLQLFLKNPVFSLFFLLKSLFKLHNLTLALIGQTVSEKKMFEIVEDDDGRTGDGCRVSDYTINMTILQILICN